ncbi:hypothetical protein WEH80_33995 [Actinomycetes bacterium KLBMP 9759]
MSRRLTRLGVPIAVTAVALAVTAAPALASPTAPAGSPVAAVADAAPHADKVRKLHELRSPKHGFRLYTLSDIEATQAQVVHGFIATTETKGIGMYSKEVEGSIAVHRLRMVGDLPRYILVSDEAELERLKNDRDDPWEFRYEGIVGWVLEQGAPGTTALHRYSKDGEWRVARPGRTDLLRAGYEDEGPLGYAPTTAG